MESAINGTLASVPASVGEVALKRGDLLPVGYLLPRNRPTVLQVVVSSSDLIAAYEFTKGLVKNLRETRSITCRNLPLASSSQIGPTDLLVRKS